MGTSIRNIGEYECDHCGSSITGAWMSQTRTLQHGRVVTEYFHADVGPYKTVLPTCAMIVAEHTALVARGWTPPPGSAGWQAAGKHLSLIDIGAV